MSLTCSSSFFDSQFIISQGNPTNIWWGGSDSIQLSSSMIDRIVVSILSQLNLILFGHGNLIQTTPLRLYFLKKNRNRFFCCCCCFFRCFLTPRHLMDDTCYCCLGCHKSTKSCTTQSTTPTTTSSGGHLITESTWAWTGHNLRYPLLFCFLFFSVVFACVGKSNLKSPACVYFVVDDARMHATFL